MAGTHQLGSTTSQETLMLSIGMKTLGFIAKLLSQAELNIPIDNIRVSCEVVEPEFFACALNTSEVSR